MHRFCGEQLQDWREALVPPTPVLPTPVMAICFEGKVHRVRVLPGPEGSRIFQEQIRQLLKLQPGEEFDVKFACKAPDSGAVRTAVSPQWYTCSPAGT